MISEPRLESRSPDFWPQPPSPAATLTTPPACYLLSFAPLSMLLGSRRNSSWLANLLNQLIFCFHQICSLGTRSHPVPRKKSRIPGKYPELAQNPSCFLFQLPLQHSSQPCLTGFPKPTQRVVQTLSALPPHFPKSLRRRCEGRFR